MKKLFILFALLIAAGFLASAEEILKGKEAASKIKGAELIQYRDGIQNPSAIWFAKDQGPLLSQAESWIANHFEFPEGTVLKTQTVNEDGLGFTHIKYNQYINEVKVEFSAIVVHSKNNRVQSINGYSTSFEPKSAFDLNEEKGLDFALNHINAQEYVWQNAWEEAELKRETGNPEATNFPKGHLVYFPENIKFSSENLIPCWNFKIAASVPQYAADVYVNAQTGEIVFENMLIKDVDTNSTAKTAYSGVRPIVSDYTGNGNFRLRENSRGQGIETYDMLNGTNYGNAVDITNDSSYWHDTLRIQYATDAHWAAEMIYDYYLNVHGRNSVDDQGRTLRSYVHYDVNYANASWNGFANRMTYGDGNASMDALTTVDIAGHEITHGVDTYTSNLVYQDESGALDESFADIFGCAIEHLYKPHATNNWLMGEETRRAIRSMQNPNSFNDPDTYGGAFYYTGTADNGGVHTNSGVQNFWFYLLVSGGSGINDKSNTYSVSGIGWDKADSIAYRSRANYLTSSSDYADARLQSIRAAYDIYGPCSPELASVENAWYAVGVGSAFNSSVVAEFAATQTESCFLPSDIYFNNLSNYNAISYTWDFGDGNSSNLRDPKHTYTAAGTYTVKLTGHGNATCPTDIETKTSYITIDPPADVQATPHSICEGYSLKVFANAPSDAFWYEDSISTKPFYIGNPYVTPPLFKDTVFYVANGDYLPAQSVGPDSNDIGNGNNFNGTHRYVEFEVYEAITIQSVKVYSYDNIQRHIELRKNDGTAVDSLIITIPIGWHTIDLNFNVEPDTMYELGFKTGTDIDMFRNSSGAAYPYTLPGLMSITSAGTAPSSYYYYFYDWKVKGRDCVGKRLPVPVSIDFDPGCVPYVGIEENTPELAFNVYPNPSSGTFDVSFDLEQDEVLNIRLLDAKGMVVYAENNVRFNQGPNVHHMQNSNLTEGFYIIQIDGANMHESRRIIIQ